MISAFYAKARYIDFLIHKRSEQKTATQETGAQQQTFQVPNPAVPQDAQQGAPQFVQIQLPVPNAENVTIALLHQTSLGIEYIYNTPVVEKLRRISDRKWYEIV